MEIRINAFTNPEGAAAATRMMAMSTAPASAVRALRPTVDANVPRPATFIIRQP
jgi:hypothetical protein